MLLVLEPLALVDVAVGVELLPEALEVIVLESAFVPVPVRPLIHALPAPLAIFVIACVLVPIRANESPFTMPLAFVKETCEGVSVREE